WAQLPYEQYLASDALNASTTPRDLAASIVDRYNTREPASNPYAIAALDMSKLPDLRAKTNALADRLLAALDTNPTGVEARIRAAYAAAQKFDYDSSLALDPTDGYVDLADFARQLLLPANVISTEVTSAAQAVVSAIGGRGEAGRVVVRLKAHS